MEQVVHAFLYLLACFIIGSSSTPAANTSRVDAKSSCPYGTLHFRGACYEYFPSSLQWYSAELQCQKQSPDGHLVSFSSSNEEKVVSAFIRSHHYGTNIVWTGLSAARKYNRLDWKWSDGFPYISGAPLWDNRRPSTSISSSECVAFYNIQYPSYSTRWIQVDCGNSYPYVCKYKA